MKKTLILAVFLCYFLSASVGLVVAADIADELTDPEGDVFIVDTEDPDLDVDNLNDLNDLPKTDTKPNLDIKKITCNIPDSSKRVTLTIEVYGTIEDKGNINPDFDDVFSAFNSIAYVIVLYTSNETYSVSYVNTECQLEYGSSGETANITDFETADGVLTLSFDLLSKNETYSHIDATVVEYQLKSLTSFAIYTDMAPDVVELEVTTTAPSFSKVNESIDFSASVEQGIAPYYWFWDFGDGEMSEEQNSSHTYAEEGTYEVTLEVIDIYENYGSDTFTIEVSNSGVSNVLSDNGILVFIAIIAVIAVVGVAVLIYIIKK